MLAKELAELLMKTPDMMVFGVSDETGMYFSPEIHFETVEDAEYYEMYNGDEVFKPEEGFVFIVI